MNSSFGITFGKELADAGVGGLHMSWFPDGTIRFDDSVTVEHRAVVEAVAAAHDPSKTLPVIYFCSPWQIRKALNQAGKRQAVESAVAASGDIHIKDGWEFATEFRSDDPFVIDMGGLIGLDEAATAALIQQASVL